MNTYPQFDSLDAAEDHVKFTCRSAPVLCVVEGKLWSVHGGGFSEPASELEITQWCENDGVSNG